MRHILLICALMLPLYLAAQKAPKAGSGLTVVFYNVENLFDTIDDPGTGDDEYLPEAAKAWDKKKYSAKLRGIADALASLAKEVNNELPVLIGIAEVENRRVLDDLVALSPLRKAGYGVIHFDSPDERGIDVALLYHPGRFTVVESRPIPVTFSFDPGDTTRDILYVKGVTDDGQPWHVYVNHWPSRSGGERQSEMKRFAAAAELRKDVDNILNFENDARIVIMGDFNDEPTNRSLMQVLNATNKRLNHSYRDLYNLMYDNHNQGLTGSLAWNNRWQAFDQIIVSFSLLGQGDGFRTGFDGGRVFTDEELMYTTPEGFRAPNRTYTGNTYRGGVSDHLPVYVVFSREEKR